MAVYSNITNSIDMNLSKLQELVMDREAWRTAVHGVRKSQTRRSDWTELYSNWLVYKQMLFPHHSGSDLIIFSIMLGYPNITNKSNRQPKLSTLLFEVVNSLNYFSGIKITRKKKSHTLMTQIV